MFTQLIDPLGNLTLTCLVALIPVVSLLVMLAVFRLPAWLATLIGSIVTFALAVWVWKMPFDQGSHAYVYGAATGVWAVDWITFWGMVLFNTLGVCGVFENFRRWLIAQGSMDVRVQTMLFAWAFGALLEGLVGFGYPWAVVAPILISLGISDLNAIRVAAIANNAPVSFGALGAPLIALAAVTGYPLLALSGSVGTVVAVLALLPPWVLLYLVSGREGMMGAWPLAVVGSLGYIAGQYPVAVHLGPYLPDVTGAIVCFLALLMLLKFWQPKTILGYGGVPVDAAVAQQSQGHGLRHWRGAAGVDAVRGAADRGRSLDGSVVAAAENQLVQGAGGRLLSACRHLHDGQAERHGRLQFRSVHRRHRDSRLLAAGCGTAAHAWAG